MFSFRIASGSVADPHHIDANPNPSFPFDADSAYHLDTDPNPDLLLIKLIQFCDY